MQAEGSRVSRYENKLAYVSTDPGASFPRRVQRVNREMAHIRTKFKGELQLVFLYPLIHHLTAPLSTYRWQPRRISEEKVLGQSNLHVYPRVQGGYRTYGSGQLDIEQQV